MLTTPEPTLFRTFCNVPAEIPVSFWNALEHTRIPANLNTPGLSLIMLSSICMRLSRGRLHHNILQFLGVRQVFDDKIR